VPTLETKRILAPVLLTVLLFRSCAHFAQAQEKELDALCADPAGSRRQDARHGAGQAGDMVIDLGSGDGRS